jgi:hypothetical protein
VRIVFILGVFLGHLKPAPNVGNMSEGMEELKALMWQLGQLKADN